MSIITIVQLTGVGGKAPYTFVTPVNGLTTLPGGTYSITGVNSDQLRIDSTSLTPGVYGLFVQILDSTPITPNVSSKVVSVRVVDPTIFTILNDNQNFQPNAFPSDISIPLLSNGGTGAVVWSLIPDVTNMPGALIDNSNNLKFTLTTFGSWTVGIRATDSLGTITSKVLLFQVVSANVFQLVDGQVEILANVPPQMSGVNNFTLSVTDNVSTSVTRQFSYTAASAVSDIRLKEAFFDHYWGENDTASVVLPIIGNLSGFSLGAVVSPVPSNGLAVTIDSSNAVVKVSGPPTSFQNSEIQVPIVLAARQQPSRDHYSSVHFDCSRGNNRHRAHDSQHPTILDWQSRRIESTKASFQFTKYIQSQRPHGSGSEWFFTSSGTVTR
jgi:hypothetical protein